MKINNQIFSIPQLYSPYKLQRQQEKSKRRTYKFSYLARTNYKSNTCQYIMNDCNILPNYPSFSFLYFFHLRKIILSSWFFFFFYFALLAISPTIFVVSSVALHHDNYKIGKFLRSQLSKYKIIPLYHWEYIVSKSQIIIISSTNVEQTR